MIVEHVGRSSVQIRYEGSVAGRPVFRARNIAVVVDMKTFRPTPLPDWLRERFEAAMDAPDRARASRSQIRRRHGGRSTSGGTRGGPA